MYPGTRARPGADVRRTVVRSVLVVVAMFGFGFAMVPIYDVICKITGLNGKTGDPYEYDSVVASVDESREVRVHFITNNNAGMPWEFRPKHAAVKVHPGALTRVDFIAVNPTGETMMGQAVPSVAPARAAQFFHKTECFCFESQTLEPGQNLTMPLRFVVDKDLPPSLQSINLSYTMYNITAPPDPDR